ncbi:hypothetical protein ACFVTM_15420 [Arthrobacter sp. NPDC058130]|uniref:hypothetical protein n=1 Tax=Arthrobacter sp. NPDC058130 TaxID=3346353 RepID=UPI0036ED2BB5
MSSVPLNAGGATKAAAVMLFAGFAGFGAGAVNLAIAASLLLAPASGAGAGAGAPPDTALSAAAGAAAGIWGCALLGWTVLTLRKGRMPWAAGTMAVLVAAALVHAAAAAGPGLNGQSLNGQSLNGRSLVISHLAALLLTLMIAAAAGWLRRQGTGADTAGLRPGRLLLSAFGFAVLVAAVATPGVAASTAGQFAVPHGSHGIPAPGGQHHGH